MNDEHLKAFVSESRESITELNNALLALEDDPNDDAAMESVFRTAHTLKGNFGAMGFSNASELAHVLEDLLDEIRADEIDVTPEIMDAVFDGVDRIETIINEIAEDGDSETDPDETTARLRTAIEDGATSTAEEATSAPGSGGMADEDCVNTGSTFEHAEEPPTFEGVTDLAYAHVEVDPDGMLGVDAMLILEALSKAVGALSTTPSRDKLEEGAYAGSFDLFVPKADLETLTETLDTTGAVEAFEATELASGASESDSVFTFEDGDESKTEGTTDEAGETIDSGAESEAASESDERDADSSGVKSDADADRSTSKSSGGSEITSVRVDVNRLDELHGLVEQLVTGRITIRRAIEGGDIETAETSLNDFDKVTSRLQNAVMDMRLIPLRRVVSNLPRVVRDVARSQEKEVSFEMYGEDIELDRSILTEIEDPLIHILRNAVDHGVEPPEEREAAGKPSEGTIELRASRQRDHVTITVSDDGDGIDPDAMRSKAVEEGVVSRSEAEAMSDDEAYDLIFHPGLSTAGEVTDVSGRGVGMDVVHSTIERLDGTVNVDSELGVGTTVELRLPVSVAIVNVLFVTVDDHEYGIPIKNIDELTPATDTETVNGEAVVRHDDEVYPVIGLEDALAVDSEPKGGESAVATDGGPPNEADGMLVRIRKSVRPVALRCDSFSDQEEVVVKPLEGSLSGIPGLSGTAILGDGNIVPILDVVSLDR